MNSERLEEIRQMVAGWKGAEHPADKLIIELLAALSDATARADVAEGTVGSLSGHLASAAEALSAAEGRVRKLTEAREAEMRAQERLLKHIIGVAGNPDAAEGCRLIIAIARQALAGVASAERSER